MQQIVVVDDDPMVATVVGDTLREFWRVTCAVTSDHGRELLVQQSWKLAVVDVRLGSISGLELAEMAAENNTPVLLISGCFDALETMHSYGFPCLAKPFGSAALVTEVRLLIAQGPEAVLAVKVAATTMRRETGSLRC